MCENEKWILWPLSLSGIDSLKLDNNTKKKYDNNYSIIL